MTFRDFMKLDLASKLEWLAYKITGRL